MNEHGLFGNVPARKRHRGAPADACLGNSYTSLSRGLPTPTFGYIYNLYDK